MSPIRVRRVVRSLVATVVIAAIVLAGRPVTLSADDAVVDPARSLRDFSEDIDFRDTPAGRRAAAIVDARRVLFEQRAAESLRKEGFDPAKVNPLQDDIDPEVVARLRAMQLRMQEEFPNSETEEAVSEFLRLVDERLALKLLGNLDPTRHPSSYTAEERETLQAVAETFPTTSTGRTASKVLRSLRATAVLETLNVDVSSDPAFRAVFEKRAETEFARAMQLVPEQRLKQVRELVQVYEGTAIATRVAERMPEIERFAGEKRRARETRESDKARRAEGLRAYWDTVYGRGR